MVNLKDLFLSAVLTARNPPLAAITMQNVFSQIPESRLRASVLPGPANRWILNSLNVEISNLLDD